MNTLKPLVIFAVLIGVCYGVYSRINRRPDAPPSDVAGAWEGAPNVENGAPIGMNSGRADAGYSDGPGGMPPLPAAAIGGGYGNGTHDGAVPPGGMPAGRPAFPSAPTTIPLVESNGGAPPPAGNPYESNPAYGNDSGYGPPSGAPGANDNLPPYAAPAGRNPLGQAGGNNSAAGSSTFAAAMETARAELDSGRLVDAHYQLSRWYDDPNLTPAEAQQLGELLDQLAGTVIYSTQHLLEPAYEVQPGETLDQVAERCHVPWQLLAKINGVEDPHNLRPGERLKVLHGPFNAIISLSKHQLTLMVNGAYAGRFPIGIGRDRPLQEGSYTVREKVADPTYYGANRTIERGDPANPLGRRWIGLGDQVGIHGTNDPRNVGRDDLAGSVSLGDRDIDDLFDILAEGSKVTVRR